MPQISNQNRSLKSRFIRRFLSWVRLTNQPTVKIYRGFGNDRSLTVMGSVLRQSALPRQKYRNNILANLLAVIRLFLIRPYPEATVRVYFGDHSTDTQTDHEGFFRVELPLSESLPPGWHRVRAELLSQTIRPQKVLAEGEGKVLVPYPTCFGCISDIDDTFLISHSATLFKRMLVLLTENAHSRRPFEGVVAHYQQLANDDRNAFFYVSSSEWNLYDYILEFSAQNGLPNGVYQLSQLKQFRQLLQTGQNRHLTKFSRIVRILETYPDHSFVLLGDDTQEDPTIYASVVEHFPHQIRCVYIRQVHQKNQSKTRATLSRIEAAGVPYCYFAHSAEARQHSLDSGLVSYGQ